MTKSIIRAVEDEKLAIRDGIGEFGLNTREKIIYWGERLRLLQPQIKGEFEEYLETLPISRATAYNWISASKQISEGKTADNISKLFTYEPAQCLRVRHGDSVMTSTYDDLEPENDPIEYEESEDEWEPLTSQNTKVSAHVIDNDKTPLDRFKQEIPETLEPVFGEAAKTFKRWKQILETVKKEMNDRAGELGFERIEQKYIKTRFDNLYELIRMAEPYCVCPVCQGDGGTGANCKVCNGKGHITKRVFDVLDKEYKIGIEI